LSAYLKKIYQKQQQCLNITDIDLNNITSLLPNRKCAEYLNYKAELTSGIIGNAFIEQWVENYDIIRATGWPDCDNLDKFELLPKEIQDECIEVHRFSPDIWLDKNITYSEWCKLNFDSWWTFSPVELIRVQSVILDNLKYIKNKNVIDFAAHTGFNSLTSLHHGANRVTATNIRQDYLNLATEGAIILGYEDRFSTEFADIHDYNRNTELTKDKDTVIISGLMYHVHDHYPILESIVKATPQTIIIETDEDKNIMDSSKAMISWALDDISSNPLAGWYKQQDHVPVGFPNPAWFDLIMSTFGYKKEKQKQFSIWKGTELEINLNTSLSRTVHVYTK
jgi:predicted nicotinamide N-methyase